VRKGAAGTGACVPLGSPGPAGPEGKPAAARKTSRVLLSVAVFVLVLGAAEVALRVALRSGAKDPRADGIVAGVQGAILGLVSLVLAFSFSFAAGRYDLRRQLVVREANAISTAFLRADMLEPADARMVRDDLRAYAALKLTIYADPEGSGANHARLESERRSRALWSRATAAIRNDPRPQPASLEVAALNDLFDSDTAALDAETDRLPLPVVIVLLIAAPLAGGTIGAVFGRTGQRGRVVVAAFAFLVALVVQSIVDLDDARVGNIRTDLGALRNAVQAMTPEHATSSR